MPKALLLDLDDTLVHCTAGWGDLWDHAIAAAGLPCPPREALLEACRKARRVLWCDEEHHRRERVDMRRAMRRIAAGALAELRVPASPEQLDAVGREFIAGQLAHTELLDGTVATLERLRAQGVRLALVTNGDARCQHVKLDRTGLRRFLDAVVIESEFGAGKPDESVYQHALALLGVTPADGWMVGDNLGFDVAGPQRAGLRAAWLDRHGQGLPPGSTVRPDRIIRSLAEMERI